MVKFSEPLPQNAYDKESKPKLLLSLLRNFIETGNQKKLRQALEVNTEIMIDTIADSVNERADIYNAAHPFGLRMPKL